MHNAKTRQPPRQLWFFQSGGWGVGGGGAVGGSQTDVRLVPNQNEKCNRFCIRFIT